MRAHHFKDHIPEKLARIDKLKGLLIRRGNKERTTSFFIGLCQTLKIATKSKDLTRIDFTAKNPLNILGEKNPIKILDRCLYNLMPAFILRRTFVAGKFYDLPVPISDNRAAFLAADWLRKAAFKDTKNAFTVPYLLTREVGAVLHKNGSAYQSLQNYIDIAIDQRPFSRYIRKKRKVISRSKRGTISQLLFKQYKKTKKILYVKRGQKNFRNKNMNAMKVHIKRKKKFKTLQKKGKYTQSVDKIKQNNKI